MCLYRFLRNFSWQHYLPSEIYVFEHKFKLKNQRRKPTLLAASLLSSNRVIFAINKALVTAFFKIIHLLCIHDNLILIIIICKQKR